MPVALPLTSYIGQDAQVERKYRVIRNQFGNGYSERASDGINSAVDTWTVTWENLSSADYNTVVAALDMAKGVDYLTWTPFGEASQKKFVCVAFTRRVYSAGYNSVSATLEQVFDL
jgi:phage-related protein